MVCARYLPIDHVLFRSCTGPRLRLNYHGFKLASILSQLPILHQPASSHLAFLFPSLKGDTRAILTRLEQHLHEIIRVERPLEICSPSRAPYVGVTNNQVDSSISSVSNPHKAATIYQYLYFSQRGYRLFQHKNRSLFTSRNA